MTLLTYDSWGSYNRIIYPPDADCTSYAVCYSWDLDGDGKVADVTEYDLDGTGDADVDDPHSSISQVDFVPRRHQRPRRPARRRRPPIGLTSVATFDPLAGRVSLTHRRQRQHINYTYDSLGRIASISSPRPEDTDPLVTFEYRPSDAATATPSPGTSTSSTPATRSTPTRSSTASDGRRRPSATPASSKAPASRRSSAARSAAPSSSTPSAGSSSSTTRPRTPRPAPTTYDTAGAAVAPQVRRSTSATGRRRSPNRATGRRSSPTAPARSSPGARLRHDQRAAPEPAGDDDVHRRPRGRAGDRRQAARPAAGAAHDVRPRRHGPDAHGTDTAGNSTHVRYDLAGRRARPPRPTAAVEYGFDPEGKLVIEDDAEPAGRRQGDHLRLRLRPADGDRLPRRHART